MTNPFSATARSSHITRPGLIQSRVRPRSENRERGLDSEANHFSFDNAPLESMCALTGALGHPCEYQYSSMPQDEFRPKTDGLPFTMVRCRRMQSHAFNLRFEKHAPLPAVLQRYQRIRVWIIPHTDAAVAQYLRAGPEKYPELCKSEVRLALRQHHAPARDRVHCIGFCQFIAETKPASCIKH